jgi:hypothetical protein
MIDISCKRHARQYKEPFVAIVKIVIIIAFLPIGFTYGGIYFCLHPSANARMRRNDMPPVRTYLDHFQRLHAELMSKFHITPTRTLRAGYIRNWKYGHIQLKGGSCQRFTILFAALDHALGFLVATSRPG